MADHHRSRRAGDPAHAVMLGAPVAAEAQPLDMPRDVGSIGERLCDVPALNNGDEIEQ